MKRHISELEWTLKDTRRHLDHVRNQDRAPDHVHVVRDNESDRHRAIRLWDGLDRARLRPIAIENARSIRELDPSRGPNRRLLPSQSQSPDPDRDHDLHDVRTPEAVPNRQLMPLVAIMILVVKIIKSSMATILKLTTKTTTTTKKHSVFSVQFYKWIIILFHVLLILI